jgi:hypothetical protein
LKTSRETKNANPNKHKNNSSKLKAKYFVALMILKLQTNKESKQLVEKQQNV